MPIQSTDTVKNHYKISKSTGLTDILIEFERVLDELGLYTYQNWIEGEIETRDHPEENLGAHDQSQHIVYLAHATAHLPHLHPSTLSPSYP